MLGDKTSLNKCKSTIIIQTMSSKCDEMKLESKDSTDKNLGNSNT